MHFTNNWMSILTTLIILAYSIFTKEPMWLIATIIPLLSWAINAYAQDTIDDISSIQARRNFIETINSTLWIKTINGIRILTFFSFIIYMLYLAYQ